MQEHVPNLTVKSLLQTRCKIRIESVKAIRFQAPQIKDALLELAEISEDSKIKSEAKCLHATSYTAVTHCHQDS